MSLASPSAADGSPDEAEKADLEAFFADYSLRHLAAHLAAAGDRTRLFRLLEETDHLARQAERFGGFEQSVFDLLEHALPLAIAAADWPRFLRFAATALHLSGLADGLAESELLAALARSGRGNLAIDAARRLPEPWQRVEALAAVASGLASEDLREPALSVLRETVESIQLPPRDPDRTAALGRLRRAARRAGPEIGERWSVWLARLPAEDSRAIRRELAEAWLDRGDPAAEGLWRAFSKAADDDRPALARRLGEISGSEARAVLSLHREKAPGIRVEIEFLAGRAAQDAASARALCEEIGLAGADFPDAERVDSARDLLACLPAAEIDRLASVAPSRGARAALTALALEVEPSDRRIAAAEDAFERLEGPPERLLAVLRYLAARPASPERKRRLGAVAAWLEDGRFAPALASPESVCRFLDLAANDLPRRAAGLLNGAAFAPGRTPADLLLFARSLAAEPPLERLIAQAETYASAVAPHAGAGFALRAEIRIEAAVRLCAIRGDLRGLTLAAPLLLPEEEDELRERLARRWAPAAPSAEERVRRARAVCDAMVDRRRLLLARIAALPPERFPAEHLAPAALYAALADDGELTGEICTLAALAELPLDPPEIAARHLMDLQGPGRAAALLALARHAIAFEQAAHGEAADRGTALGLLRSALRFDSDRALAAATPEIAALGSAGEPARADLEIDEAARRLATLAEVPWSDRRSALARLFAHLPETLRSDARGRTRRNERVASSLALLPQSLGVGPAKEELRAGWPTLAPILTAAVERLGALPGEAPRGFPKALESGFGALRSEREREILELCLATAAERTSWIERALSTDAPGEPATLILLAPLRPERAVDLARLCPPGEPRDAACRFLLRERWLWGDHLVPNGLAEEVTERMARAEAQVWARLDAADPEWLETLGAWLGEGASRPDDPGLTELRRRLWRADSTASRPALAHRFADALRTGGRPAAEVALLWFLNAHLPSRLGDENPSAIAEIPAVRSVLARALELPRNPVEASP